MKLNLVSLFVLIVALLALSPARIAAQGTTGNILGTVTDSTGAVIPNAQVTVTNLETNFTRNGVTNASGEYLIQFLPLGSYRVEVTAPTFKKFAQTGVVLEINRNARVDAVLTAGAVTETVSVTSNAPLVETTQPALGQTINNQDIINLPLVNRDIYSLLELTAGVDTTFQATDNFGAPMRVTLVNGSSNGGAGSVNYSLDGGTNASGLRNTGNQVPNPDAVREFRVITNSYSAEYGRFAGGVVDVVTKSGTNALHGSVFEFLRNDVLNANRWVPGQSLLAKDPLKRNQFGGSFGGPIIRDRTFYFGSYSGLRQRQTNFANTATPPTAAERNGIFTGRIRDPLKTGNCTATDQTACFTNNTIPIARFDPAAKQILDKYIPLPNLPNGLYEVQDPHPLDTDELQFKVDHALTSAHQLTGSYFWTKGKDIVGLLGNLNWVDREFSWRQHNYNIGETWTIGPTMINQFRLTYVRNFGGRVNTPAIALGDLGSKYQIQGAPSLPQIQVAGRFNLNSAIPGPVAGSNLYQVRDVLSLNRGGHSIKFGGEVSLEKIIHDTLLNNYGTFSFATSNARGTGNALADFLLGLPTTMNQDAPVTKIDNGWYFGLFVQDDFRIHPRLTLNLGLRYDLQLPYTDPHDRKLTYVAGKQSVVVKTAPLGLLFPGDPGVTRGIVATDRNNIAPRIGFAWDVKGDGKTAVRGSFGIFYGSMSGNEWNATADGQPFSIRQRFTNVKSLSDPYGLLPGGVSPFPYSYDPNSPRFVFPASVTGPSLDFVLPYTYQMNLSVQRQLTNDLSVTASYVSTLGHKLPFDRDINYPVYNSTATTTNFDQRRPILPGTFGAVTLIQSILNTSYHGLQVTAERRFARSFSVKGFYTFGKSLDGAPLQASTRGGAQDLNNLALERGRTDNDRKHNLVFSSIWEISYFKRTQWLVRSLADGWSISAIASFRSGLPLTITSGNDNNRDGNTNDRADLIGNPVLDHDRPRSEVVAKWFNTDAFRQNGTGQDGTAGRNIIDGPGLKNVDLGLFRNFNFTERIKLQFRAEATNAFNIVNLSNPTTGQNSSTFGQIRTARAMRQVQLGLRLSF
jgi:carboxypeptidase family protein